MFIVGSPSVFVYSRVSLTPRWFLTPHGFLYPQWFFTPHPWFFLPPWLYYGDSFLFSAECYNSVSYIRKSLHTELHICNSVLYCTKKMSSKYTCTLCNKSFSCNASWKKHRSEQHVSPKKYECSVCHRKFNQNITLTIHYRLHTGELPYQCVYCNKKFRAQSLVDVHARRKHLTVKPPKPPKPPKVPPQPFPCTLCHHLFTTCNQLQIHRCTALTASQDGTTVEAAAVLCTLQQGITV